MDLGFTDDQMMIKKSAREFLEKECTMDFVREMEGDEKGYSGEMWNKMADLEWMGIPFPEEYGGTNGSFLDVILIIEEMGRALLPAPFIPTIVSSGLPILYYGNKAQKEELLPKLASGKLIMTFAIIEKEVKYEEEGIKTEAGKIKDGFSLNGIKLFVQDAHIADKIACVARANEGCTVFILDYDYPGIAVTPLKTLSGDKLCEVALNEVKVPEERILGDVGKGWEIAEKAIQLTIVAISAFMNGAARKVLELSVEYAKQRVQFDRYIGSFQAIQHKCADMLMAIEGSEYLTYGAAWKLDKGEDAKLECSMAKAWASDALKKVWMDGVKIHGGTGISIDSDIPLFFKSGKEWEIMFGDGDYYLEKIAKEMKL
jgi:alkylation response protein AidB-like acyl-CoA dehydrogenase